MITQISKMSMRDALGEALVELGDKNPNIVALTANLGESTGLKPFADKFPERFFDIGVSEQNLVTVASGLAAVGKLPFITSYAAFSPGRNWEQIKTTIALNDVPVVIVGNHAGLSAAVYGATHMGMEDLAMMRSLPNIIVLSPCDYWEIKKAVAEAVLVHKPVYLRLPRGETSVITTKDSDFKIGRVNLLHESRSPRAVIFATGPLLAAALLAADKLKDSQIEVVVVNIHTLKPLDEATVSSFARNAGAVVTVEEHQETGGLGAAIAEVLVKTGPVPMEMLGIKDTFGESGSYQQLLDKHHLNVDGISEAVMKVLTRVSQQQN